MQRTTATAILFLSMLLLASCQNIPVPKVIGTISLAPNYAYQIGVDSETGIGYARQGTGSVAFILSGANLSHTVVFDTNSGTPGSVLVQPNSNQAVILDSANRAIYALQSSGTYHVTRDPSFNFRGPVSRSHDGGLANTVNGYLYAINYWDHFENGKPIGGSVLVITNTEVIMRIHTGRFASFITMNSMNGLVYVGHDANSDDPEDHDSLLTVISGTQIISQSDISENRSKGTTIDQIIVNPDTGLVFVEMRQRLFALDANLHPVREFVLGAISNQIMYNRVDHHIYVMQPFEILVLDTDLNEIKRIPTEPKSRDSNNSAMAIDPIRGYVYVGSRGNGTMTVIHNMNILTRLKVGWNVVDIGIYPHTGLVYSVNSLSQDITVIGFPSSL